MPIPFLLGGAAAIAGIAGLVKGGQAVSNNAKAKELVEDAVDDLYRIAQNNGGRLV